MGCSGLLGFGAAGGNVLGINNHLFGSTRVTLRYKVNRDQNTYGNEMVQTVGLVLRSDRRSGSDCLGGGGPFLPERF